MRDTRARETGGKSREREPSAPEHAPQSPDAQRLLELQRTVGNAAVARLIAATPGPRRLAREEEAPGEEAVPLDETPAAGGTGTLSLAGLLDGVPIQSFVWGSGKQGQVTEAEIWRQFDRHSDTIRNAAGKRIASGELKGRGRSGTVTFKMQNVLVEPNPVYSDTERFKLTFDRSSVEQT